MPSCEPCSIRSPPRGHRIPDARLFCRLSLLLASAIAITAIVFGLLTLGLAVLGLYSTVFYSVSQRQTEMAIRTALGAQPFDIFATVLRHTTWVAVIVPPWAWGRASHCCRSRPRSSFRHRRGRAWRARGGSAHQHGAVVDDHVRRRQALGLRRPRSLDLTEINSQPYSMRTGVGVASSQRDSKVRCSAGWAVSRLSVTGDADPMSHEVWRFGRSGGREPRARCR